MNPTIKEVKRGNGAKAYFPIISDKFLTISNWNTYSEGDKISDDEGNKYLHRGVINNAVLVEPINKQN